MRAIYLYMPFILIACSCSTDELDVGTNEKDTKPPMIHFVGREVDTAYLNTLFKDKGVTLLDEATNGELKCVNGMNLETTGYVDTHIKGTYTLSYIGYDNAGNASARLTRTVHVVPNTLNDLCGDYLVSYTCTTCLRGTEGSTVTTGNYKATLAPGIENNHFELASLNTGPMFKVLKGNLEGDKMIVDYWDTDFAKTEASGIVSKDQNSFTIEANTFMYTHLYYKVVNVYTKQLVIKTLSQK